LSSKEAPPFNFFKISRWTWFFKEGGGRGGRYLKEILILNLYSFEENDPRFTRLKPGLPLKLLSKGLFYIRAMMLSNLNNLTKKSNEIKITFKISPRLWIPQLLFLQQAQWYLNLSCFVLFWEPPPLFKYDQTKCHYLLTHDKFLGHFFYTLSEGRRFNQ
jgi:hypothetical protein